MKIVYPQTLTRLSKDGDLDAGALSYPVVLQIYYSRRGHLCWTKHCHNLQNSIIKTWCQKTVIFFCSPPKVGTSHKTEKNTRLPVSIPVFMSTYQLNAEN